MPNTVIEQDTDIKGPTDRYGFPIAPAPVAHEASTSKSLEAMVGGFVTVGGGFFIKPPKLKEQKAMLRLAATLDFSEAGLDSTVRNVEISEQILLQILYREDIQTDAFGGRHQEMRRATLEEIEEAFDAEQLGLLVKDYAGVSPGK